MKLGARRDSRRGLCLRFYYNIAWERSGSVLLDDKNFGLRGTVRFGEMARNFAPGAAPPDKSNAREVVWGSGTPRVTCWASSKFYDIGFVKKE